jgi:hypothetical protein
MYDEGYADKSTPERESSGLQLQYVCAELSKEVEMLEQRLVPVLRRVPEDQVMPSTMLRDSSDSPLADRVAELREVRAKITNLIQRLDV